MESESMTVARIREEVAVIDKMFEEATGWGSWMVSSANRREVLINRLHKMGYQDSGIIYLTPDNSSGSYLLMQRAIPPQPRGGCYAG